MTTPHVDSPSSHPDPATDNLFKQLASVSAPAVAAGPPLININGLHSPFPTFRGGGGGGGGDPGPSTASHRSAAGNMAPPSSQRGEGGNRKAKLRVEGLLAEQVCQLQTHLEEIVELSRGYADQRKAVPSDVLIRVNALSTLIHRQLVFLQPQVYTHLHPSYSLAREPTAAERDMEMIRVRRDALIAKAAAAAALAATTTAAMRRGTEVDEERTEEVVVVRGRWIGKCHSCGTAETGNWRTGPDGPGSLCDTCGAHYAKLTRSGPLMFSSPGTANKSTPLSYTNPYPQPATFVLSAEQKP